jgi:hypothetical protein
MDLDGKYILMMQMMRLAPRPTLREMAAELCINLGSVQDRVKR